MSSQTVTVPSFCLVFLERSPGILFARDCVVYEGAEVDVRDGVVFETEDYKCLDKYEDETLSLSEFFHHFSKRLQEGFAQHYQFPQRLWLRTTHFTSQEVAEYEACLKAVRDAENE